MPKLSIVTITKRSSVLNLKNETLMYSVVFHTIFVIDIRLDISNMT